ncbi:hypothetical protein [Dinghuibacter silviterrae]|uniref:Uncharacterized protein n=1 Tax=Dinghuibacter silviterrae TaxID=1539049 RepID=A0A4R8DEI5_9BACT|nr:hypothetical protein [Dinghuibacter silviterrae]TDW95963.1 hypothetical protein EDB95_3784 [Dinghuibacter silviterrae]
MRHTNKSVIALNTPLRLTPDQIEAPEAVVTDFFSNLSLDETREILWEAFSRALCTEEEGERGLSHRELLYFHQEIEALIEAAFLLKH